MRCRTSGGRGTHDRLVAAVLMVAALAGAGPARGQPPSSDAPIAPNSLHSDRVADEAIAARLEGILSSAPWFDELDVRVRDGVVTLLGRAHAQDHGRWAEQLATETDGVVAVINRLQIVPRSPWDLSEPWAEMQRLWTDTVRLAPRLGIGLLLLVTTGWATRSSKRGASFLLRQRIQSPLLRSVAARAVAAVIFVLGLYLVLRVSGLTGLAVTVLGGTGLVGLVIGFAFRDIAENVLASILLAMQHPFAVGDLIDVDGHQGFVQGVNTRSTLLMTLEGNHVQIPNATIYKGTIVNFTANPYARFDFGVGIGYDDSIAEAQAVALKVLQEHPAVVDDPEALVLVDALGAATVNLRVYFWIDIATYSHLKVRSAVIRQTKQAFEDAGISMPDEAREVVFPKGVPIQTVEQPAAIGPALPRPDRRAADSLAVQGSEGNLSSEAEEIQRQAREARQPEEGPNILGR